MNVSPMGYDQINVGAVYSFERTITQEDGRIFAALSGDQSELSTADLSPETGIPPRTVVHGMLAATFFSNLVDRYCPGPKSVYVSQTLQFRLPLFYNDRLLVRGTVTEKSDSLQLITLKTELLRGEDVVVNGEAKVKAMARTHQVDHHAPVSSVSSQQPTGISVKRVFKHILFLVVKAVPRSFFFHISHAYARRPRSRGKFGFYLERAMNYAHRRLVTEQLRLKGVPYFPDRPDNRYELYRHVIDRSAKGPVDYLEFGVAHGASMRFALETFSPESHCYGFDSFEGLPQDWYHGITRGTFAAAGQAPAMNAPNLTFVKGWFEDSLQPFLASATLKPQLVIHMDADLYAPTIYVLRTLQQQLIPGTIVIFDEYWFLKDEFRALEDFVRESGKTFSYLAISDMRAAIQFSR